MELLASSTNPPLDLDADMVVKMGASLEEIWEHSNAREKISKGDYDVVILQGDIPATDSWNISNSAEMFHEYVRKFNAEIKEAGAETVLFMQWPYEQYGLKPITIEEIDQAHHDIAAELGVEVAPVGLAWQRVMEERPQLDMYDDDEPSQKMGVALTMSKRQRRIIYNMEKGQISYEAELGFTPVDLSLVRGIHFRGFNHTLF